MVLCTDLTYNPQIFRNQSDELYICINFSKITALYTKRNTQLKQK